MHPVSGGMQSRVCGHKQSLQSWGPRLAGGFNNTPISLVNTIALSSGLTTCAPSSHQIAPAAESLAHHSRALAPSPAGRPPQPWMPAGCGPAVAACRCRQADSAGLQMLLWCVPLVCQQIARWCSPPSPLLPPASCMQAEPCNNAQPYLPCHLYRVVKDLAAAAGEHAAVCGAAVAAATAALPPCQALQEGEVGCLRIQPAITCISCFIAVMIAVLLSCKQQACLLAEWCWKHGGVAIACAERWACGPARAAELPLYYLPVWLNPARRTLGAACPAARSPSQSPSRFDGRHARPRWAPIRPERQAGRPARPSQGCGTENKARGLR